MPKWILTILGLGWSSLSPCPSLPYLPFPQVYSSPVEVMQALWAPPADIDTTCFPRRDSITRGRSQGLKEIKWLCLHTRQAIRKHIFRGCWLRHLQLLMWYRVASLRLTAAGSPCVLSLSVSETLYPLLSNGSTQEDLSQHGWKNVDWDISNQIKQTNKNKALNSGFPTRDYSNFNQLLSPALHPYE